MPRWTAGSHIVCPGGASTSSKVGPIADSIIKAAEEGKFDLLVMGTHGHGTLGRLVMGSVSTQVLAGILTAGIAAGALPPEHNFTTAFLFGAAATVVAMVAATRIPRASATLKA